MKKVNKRKWMILLGILTILIVPLNKAKAMTVSSEFTQNNGAVSYTIQPGEQQASVYFHDIYGNRKYIFQNVGAGWINFNVAIGQSGNGHGYGYDYRLEAGGNTFQCEVGNQQFYSDNDTMRTIATVRCPVFAGSQGVTALYIIRYNSTGSVGYTVSNLWTFTSESEVSSAIMNNTNAMIQQQINNDNTNTQAIINATQQQTQQMINNQNAIWQQEAQHWEAMENTDISANAKQQPSQQNYDQVHTFEEGIFSDLDDPNILALIDLGIDTETNNWIWNTMTGIFNANVRVMSMVISVLTLGLAKFLMGR